MLRFVKRGFVKRGAAPALLGVLLASAPAAGQTPFPNPSSTPPAPMPSSPRAPMTSVTNPPTPTTPDAAPLDAPAPEPGLGAPAPDAVTGTGAAASADRFACGPGGTQPGSQPPLRPPIFGQVAQYALLHNNRCPGGHGDWAATDQGSGARFQADVDLDALHLDHRAGRLANAGRLTLLVDGVAAAPDGNGTILIRATRLLRSLPEPSRRR